MADSSIASRLSGIPSLVEILKKLGRHHRQLHKQTYGKGYWTREESDAYWHHPLKRVSEWLEEQVGISRHDLETAAYRLATPLGLCGMDELPGPNGKNDEGQPDWLWMIPKFRELDQDGTTAELWEKLNTYPAILKDAGLMLDVTVKCRATYSPDYRSVNWFGNEYNFTPNQAVMVKMLWECWKQGSSDVGDSTLLEAADCNSDRLNLVFRDNPAWGTMIVAGKTRGTRRLAEPKS